jgi:tetratricopeptide (TPR) repeat protein
MREKMKQEKTPPDESRTTVPSTLFCLCWPADSEHARADETHRVEQDVAKLLPTLNLSSSCYLIRDERPGEPMLFDSILDEISSFLEENRFVQISVRPVHPFSSDDADEWIEAYLRFLRICKPFQEEGYREQIIARLRIFPVIFLNDAAAVAGASPFLRFLQDSFFLPSILVPEVSVSEIAALQNAQDKLPWVRVYVTDASAFAPQRTLAILHAHEIFDKLLEEDRDEFPDGNLPCLDSLTLDPGGSVRSCINPKVRDRTSCMECLLPTMEPVGISYRFHTQGTAAWHRLCDRMATRLVRKGMHGQGLTVWESSAKAYDPDVIPPQLLLQIALCHHTTGDLEKAMEALTEAQRKAPLSADIRYYMGLCEFGWRDYIEAADRFREAIELGLQNPLRVEAQYYRGLSHYHLEEYDEALGPLAQAEQAGMGGSPLPFYQGLCLLGKQQPEQGLPYLQQALSRGPSQEDLFHVLFYLAHTYKELEDFRQGLSYCGKAEAVDPKSQELWNLAGFCHFKLREYDEAIECFKKAIEIDPTSAIDYANIGSNLRDKGDAEGAIAMYQKALSLDPSIEFARDSLKRLLDAGKGR